MIAMFADQVLDKSEINEAQKGSMVFNWPDGDPNRSRKAISSAKNKG